MATGRHSRRLRQRATALVLLWIAVVVPSTLWGQEERELPPIVVEPDEPLVAPESGSGDEDLGRFGLFDQRLGQDDGFGENTGVFRGAGNIFDIPFAADLIGREKIQEKLAPDMFHALQNEVGILMQSTGAGQASPFVRGLTGQQVLILVDGIRLSNSVFRFGPNQYFNTIDPGAIDHVEVLRGGGSVLWGSDAIGGVINLVTRSPSTLNSCCGDYQGGEFHQTFNTANNSPYTRVNVEGWVGRVGAFGGASMLNVRDLDTGWNAIGRQPGTNYEQYAGDIKLNMLLDDSQMLTLALQHHEMQDVSRSDRYPGFPGDRNNSNSFGGARFFDPQQRDLAYLRYQSVDPFAWSDALTITGSYHRQRDNQKRGFPTTSRSQETDVETTGFNIVSSKQVGYARLTSGVDWYHDNVASRFGGSASGPIIPDGAYYDRFGWFLNSDTRVLEGLTAQAGIRYERIKAGATPLVGVQNVFISPSYNDWIAHAGMTYELSPCVRLVGSVSEGFRAPNLDELTANNPNVLQGGMDLPSLDLIPERSINYEVGLKTDYAGLKTQTFVFWNDLNNNIVPISAGANQFRRDNQDSFIQGVEFEGELALDMNWSLYGNCWYTYGENLVTDSPLSRIPPTQGILGLRWREGSGYVNVYTWMVRRQDRLDPVRDLGDERIPIGGTPGYATLNLRLGRAYGQHDQHLVSLSLENLTDKNYLVHGSGVFGTGATARFGYSLIY